MAWFVGKSYSRMAIYVQSVQNLFPSLTNATDALDICLTKIETKGNGKLMVVPDVALRLIPVYFIEDFFKIMYSTFKTS